MRKIILSLAVLLTCGLSTLSMAAEQSKKSLVIMLDGLRSDVMFTAATPAINSLIDGTWAGPNTGYRSAWTYQAHTNLDALPSSATNHVAIATGVTATKNNVYENGKIGEGKYDEFPSYLERLKQANPQLVTAFLRNWSEDDLIRTKADYEQRYADKSGAELDMLLVDDAVAILAGTKPDSDGANGTHWKAGTDVDALMLYLDAMDMYGHGKGFSPFVDEYYTKMTEYDAAIGRMLQAVCSRPNFADESWQIIVVSDHGGLGQSHGIQDCENCYTIPLVVVSKEVAAGRMVGQPQNCDVAAYVMQFMTGSVPTEFDGRVEVVHNTESVAVSLEDGIVYRQPSSVTPEKLGRPESLNFGADGDFSITLWFRTDKAQQGDPVIIGNKDWTSGKNPGVVLAANTNDQDGTNLWLNISDGTTRDDLRPLAYQADGQWWFIGVTVERKGNAVLYLGRSDGRLTFISDDISTLGNIDSPLNWNVTEDGTGDYSCDLNGEIRELTIRNRALSLQDVETLSKNPPRD